ncbi:hemagglutination activity domain protein [Richelia sinica FACHB-800]|uniref:Hemagglutination activity domain protein n=1 Tax=Richelia sinica FACHB-800 TaxID=1357546 RepID=A0A975Y6I0_9NOST|nr:filamentous hemagglutinin N-terminal domain-containing protein [Richelia sinica]MBD2667409.1 filamentous hemagglutinin N-terminal domain-containing protein [Richelia sinica FACHB-800]QXE25302.1 hemagglutination activity domain protein [Richelia sinica FACHB-800]
MWIVPQWQRLVNLQIAISLFANGILANCPSVLAQIKPDNTLGQENSVINKVDNLKDLITGGTTRGANLFHSFDNFNVGTGKSVYFANPLGIENILTRVTGGSASNILGKLGVEGTANLFLINPQGIYFGKDASLDIKGSFTATTADAIKLGESGLFSAAEPAKSNLLNIQPGALFANALKNLQGSIKNEGSLKVDDGKNLTFVGANIINTGALTVGKDLNISGINVNLKAANLRTGGSLNLTATEKIKIEDSINKPVILQSAGDITIQGDQSIEIKALNHHDSNFISDRDIIFRSPVRLLSQGRYTVGGYFTTEDLNHNLIDFLIPHNNVIKVNGDISLGDYTGSSLYILAGGKATLSNVTINNPDNKPINQSITDGQGGSQIVTVNSKNDVGILDVRTGIYPHKIPGGLPNNPSLPSNVTANVVNTTSADIITIAHDKYDKNGNFIGANITNNGGNVLLTNQYKSNFNLLSQSTNITVGNIDTSSFSDSGKGRNGGGITLNAGGNISTQSLSSSSSSYSESGNAGNGGGMTLTAGANISTQSLDSSSYSFSGTAGNGGGMTLTAGANISTQSLDSSSYSLVKLQVTPAVKGKQGVFKLMPKN